MSTERSKRKKELVFIKGYSGVGKSTLASFLEKSVTGGNSSKSTRGQSGDNNSGVFLRGKFDLNNRDEPYSGIASAFSEICRTVRTSNTKQAKRRASGIISRGRRQSGLRRPSCDSSTAFFVERSQDSFDTDEETANNNNLSTTIGKEIMAELGKEAQLLVNLIPELESILPSDSKRRRSSFVTVGGDKKFDAEQERWKYSFRVLTRVLSTYLSPLVLFLDDLQWADPQSLEVIDMLISDTENSNPLMIIGCYRSNEVDERHILTKRREDLLAKQDRFQFNTTDIQLGNFGVDDVNKIIMALLSLDDAESTQWLAEICLKRTLGNPFFLIQFITTLKEHDLITYNLGLLKWSFDQEAIENMTIPTANVVDLLQARMRKLSQETQLVLQYAACLGSSFSSQILALLWTKHAIPNNKSWDDESGNQRPETTTTALEPGQKLPDLLRELEKGNFIEIYGQHRTFIEYRWVHDNVQEAALLLGDAAQDSFQFQIGLLLYDSLARRELEEALFDVVHLINQGDDEKRRPEIIELNLRAAKKAQNISAFHSAAVYVSHAISLLSDDRWTSCQDLTLRLYTLGAEMELAVGRDEIMENYSNEVLTRTDLSILDRLPIYVTKFQKLCDVDGKYDETISLCMDVLAEMGCKFPRGGIKLPIVAISTLLKTVKKAKRVSKVVYEQPRVMTDPTQSAIMLFLARLFYASYHSKNKLFQVLSACNMVQMTLKHGVCSVSGQAYATLGLMTTAVLGDFGTGSFFAETSLLIQQTVGTEYTEAITNFVSYYGPLPWTNPIQSSTLPFMEGYVSGMRSGNVEYAMWNALHSLVVTPYQMGKPLAAIEAECIRIISQADDLKQLDHATSTKMYRQMFLNLMGKSTDPIKLKGDAFDVDVYEPTSPLLKGVIEYTMAELLVYFGEWEQAAELALSKGFIGASPGSVGFMFQTCRRGVAMYAMAHRTKKRLYKKHADKIRKTIEQWMKKGNPNVQHYHSLLSAEHAALHGKIFNAETLYKGAIQLAARAGYLNDAALFNERYADFLLRSSPNSAISEDEANYRIEQAIHFYNEWGAKAKVEILEDNLAMGISTTT